MAIPFFLLKTKDTKTNKVNFVETKMNTNSRDTIKLYEIGDGKEKEHFMEFRIGEGKRAYFYHDTLGILLSSYGGYNLLIELRGEEYISKLTSSKCVGWRKLKIQEQRLELEDFKLVHNGKLKGNYYCEASHKDTYKGEVEKVRIRGYFEFDLIDEVEAAKEWQ